MPIPVDYMTAQRQQADPRTTGNVNSLRALMDFYSQMGPQASGYQGAATDNQRRALNFATSMMQRNAQAPDFSSQPPPAFAPAQQFSPVPMQSQTPMSSPLMDQSSNYLRQLFRGPINSTVGVRG